jgi:hypothetical protein
MGQKYFAAADGWGGSAAWAWQHDSPDAAIDSPLPPIGCNWSNCGAAVFPRNFRRQCSLQK